MSAARTERLLNLLTLLLNTRKPVSLREIRELPEFDAYATGDPKSGERAFERDKAALVELGIPLRWIAPEQDEDDDGGGYYIDRERYYLPELLLAPPELALLSIAGAAAATIEGFPERAAVVRALAKLGFDIDDAARPVRALAHAPLPPGNAEELGAHLAVLHEAVGRRLRVAMRYKSVRGEVSKRDVDPYGLYYRRGVWYLVGYCHLREAERTFHLGRIVSATPTGRAGAFDVPKSFDLSTHVHKRPWEYGDEAEIDVVVRLAERLVPAIPELFGPRAVVRREGGAALVELKVRQRGALVAAVLPFGAAAEVLAPKDLRQELFAIYAALAKRYAPKEQVKAAKKARAKSS
jgi:predicted DNA-binding transcriptional regulator YafY